MLRIGSFLAATALLSLSSAAPILPLPVPATSLEQSFDDFAYPLGDFSAYIADAQLGRTSQVEGNAEAWACHLEFGLPAQNFSEWIHPVDLICAQSGEEYIWPLGEGVFRKAYTESRYLVQGAAAGAVDKILNAQANAQDVESPVSSRLVAWGPARIMNITTLRKSDAEGNLHFSLECYRDEKTSATHSCALQF